MRQNTKFENIVPLKLTGPPYEHEELRRGIPLNYIAEKLHHSLLDFHTAYHETHDTDVQNTLYSSFRNMVKTFAGLWNMLEIITNEDYFESLLAMTHEEISQWINSIERVGSLTGEHKTNV